METRGKNEKSLVKARLKPKIPCERIKTPQSIRKRILVLIRTKKLWEQMQNKYEEDNETELINDKIENTRKFINNRKMF